jgi:hypothetical protein
LYKVPKIRLKRQLNTYYNKDRNKLKNKQILLQQLRKEKEELFYINVKYVKPQEEKDKLKCVQFVNIIIILNV